MIFKILNNGLDNPAKYDQSKLEFDKILAGKNTKGLTERALRYDLTIPFARYVAMNHAQLTMPFKVLVQLGAPVPFEIKRDHRRSIGHDQHPRPVRHHHQRRDVLHRGPRPPRLPHLSPLRPRYPLRRFRLATDASEYLPR